jgi:hypothetical protein
MGGKSMTYTLKLEQKPAWIHAVVTGRNSRDNVARYLDEVIAECTTLRCDYVLIEERLEGPRLRTMDVFEIASQRGKPLPATLKAMAYVDVNAEGDLMRFAEDVAVNRGSPVRVFSSVDDAERWLEDQVGASKALRSGGSS